MVTNFSFCPVQITGFVPTGLLFFFFSYCFSFLLAFIDILASM